MMVIEKKKNEISPLISASIYMHLIITIILWSIKLTKICKKKKNGMKTPALENGNMF